MSYKNWIKSHAKKHKEIINRLGHLNDDEIIKYFRFENMVKNEPNFCPLYKDNKKCHDIDDLNCYLCACPYFRVDKLKSCCDIDHKYGGSIKGQDGYIHQDCSNCSVPHSDNYIKHNFNRDWKEIMKNSIDN